ncbi:tRNA (cytosine(72)-C(5))-methyltransferase NSUN6 [Aplysia californica]|uniref:tRNA (Cytosine(72)-C(5))-methyltransferase NSUN6 n=1 Tax=Aplysia californica TaxID=6500 RepID=A0ABM0JJC2_APLCA|nr:tRNA (cytosine(72)-C(5))-methyltransferase NSUN6 [Aplysia californica]
MEELQLQPDVHTALVESFPKNSSNLSHLLKILCRPPLFSTLRINLQLTDITTAIEALRGVLAEQCKLTGMAEFTLYQHPVIDDCIIIENRGPFSLPQVEKEIVVDLSCGMAVLRGANVFAQGIMACPQNLRAGDTVSVFSDLDGKCLKGFAGKYPGRKFHVGNGVAQVARSDLFNASGGVRGIGILMTQPVYEAPAMNDLPFPWVFSQNLPSMACAHFLGPQPGERVLDMCAAPGGKTSHIAALMKNSGVVVALEKSSERASKMSNLMEKLGLDNVKCFQFDSTKAVSDISGPDDSPPYLPASFDRVLVDAPCSALGQRPCAVNRLSLNQLKSYPVLQHKILLSAVQLVRPGGVLVYSTCTVCVDENEDQVARLLTKCPDLELCDAPHKLGGPGLPGSKLKSELLSKVQRFDPSIQLTQPDVRECYNVDTIGFFIAVFRKRSSPDVYQHVKSEGSPGDKRQGKIT